MFTRLKISDFQSIKEADIELAPFTVIVGANRSGKSATLRALRSLCFNATGSGFIRRGQPKCEVTVETDDSEPVTWTKTKTTAEYSLGDRRFTKLAGGVPYPIESALRVRRVDVDSTLTLVPQLHLQGEYAFLIDRSAGQAARALAKMTKLDIVVKAQQSCKAALREAKTRLTAVKQNIEATQKELDEFPDMDRWEAEIEALRDKLDILSAYVARYASISQYIEVLESTKLPPEVEADFKALQKQVGFVTDLFKLIEALASEVPELVPDTGDLVELTTNLSDGFKALEQYMFIKAGEEVILKEATLFDLEEKDIHEHLDELRGTECPTCGGIID